MFRIIALLVILIGCHSICEARYPDGTLVLSSKKGLVGRVAKRITGGDQYTHAAIIIDGKLYESDWPRAKAGPIQFKRRTTNDFFVPTSPYTATEIARMRAKANSLVGRRYDLRNYRFPGTRKTYGTWCSPFVGEILNASGKYRLSFSNYYEPQNLIHSVNKQYKYLHTIRK